MKRNKFLLLNYVFVVSIILLFINDHFLKLYFHNWFTGKFSDFLGMIIFPLFLAYIFPKLRIFSILVSFVLFIFWKSPFSEGFIDFYNQISPIALARVVDYTDFIAFVFLIIPFLLIKYDALLQPLKIRKISPALILVPSVFVMMATSPPPYYRYGSDRMDYSFKMQKSRAEALDELKNRNILFKKDTLMIIKRNNISSESLIMNGTDLKTLEVDKEILKKKLERKIRFYDYYIIDSLKIGDETLKDIRFELEELSKSKIKIILKSVVLEERNTNNKKLQKKFRKIYRELLKKEFLNKNYKQN
jgi:putative membrane protein